MISHYAAVCLVLLRSVGFPLEVNDGTNGATVSNVNSALHSFILYRDYS